MATEQQIDEELQALKEIKPKVRHFSAFGDDNRAAIAAQIEVLTGRLTEDEVFERFDGGPDNVLDAARHAQEWMDGDSDETPSEGWKILVK